jgi:hypothetical protein
LIKKIALKAAPMCKLLKKGTHYWWDEDYEKSFYWMKTTLNILLVLIVPDWTREFHVHTYVSNYVIGAMLAQNLENIIDKPIYYANQLMTRAKKNHSTIEKEALVMIYALKKFRHYLLGNNFTFFIDHQALIYLVNKPIVTR